MTDGEGNLVWGLLLLGKTEEQDEHNGNGAPTLPITESVRRQ